LIDGHLSFPALLTQTKPKTPLKVGRPLLDLKKKAAEIAASSYFRTFSAEAIVSDPFPAVLILHQINTEAAEDTCQWGSILAFAPSSLVSIPPNGRSLGVCANVVKARLAIKVATRSVLLEEQRACVHISRPS